MVYTNSQGGRASNVTEVVKPLKWSSLLGHEARNFRVPGRRGQLAIFGGMQVAPPVHVIETATAVAVILRDQSRDLVDLGMLTPEARDRWEGRYENYCMALRAASARKPLRVT